MFYCHAIMVMSTRMTRVAQLRLGEKKTQREQRHRRPKRGKRRAADAKAVAFLRRAVGPLAMMMTMMMYLLREQIQF